MGSYDGAEICELVGLYILDLLSQQFDKQQLGLYRDDGATAINLPGPEIERAKTAIRETFEKCNLRVIIENDTKRMDFLDVTMDLTTGKHWPSFLDLRIAHERLPSFTNSVLLKCPNVKSD